MQWRGRCADRHRPPSSAGTELGQHVAREGERGGRSCETKSRSRSSMWNMDLTINEVTTVTNSSKLSFYTSNCWCNVFSHFWSNTILKYQTAQRRTLTIPNFYNILLKVKTKWECLSISWHNKISCESYDGLRLSTSNRHDPPLRGNLPDENKIKIHLHHYGSLLWTDDQWFTVYRKISVRVVY